VDKIAFTLYGCRQAYYGKSSTNLEADQPGTGRQSPNIVFPDADMAAAVGGAFFGIYLNSGQVCQAGSRLLLHESIKDEFMQQLSSNKLSN